MGKNEMASRRNGRDNGKKNRCQLCAVGVSCCFFAVPQFEAVAEPRFYGRNFTLFRQGESPGHFYQLRSGWLQLTHLALSGKAVVDFAGPGSILGAVELVVDADFAVTAQTLEECELEAVQARNFRSLLEQHPAVMARLLLRMSRQLRRANDTLYDVVAKVSSEKRLMRALHEIAETCGSRNSNGTLIRLPLTVQDLAEKIGCSRQWTSKLMSNLQSAGLLERKGGWIVIPSAQIVADAAVAESADPERGVESL